MDMNAQLVLEDGTILKGISIGVKGKAVGELVFNTAHVGYQEALTDPSYTGQIIAFTSPHIGNIGCNIEDEESTNFCVSGLVIREKPTKPSYWRSKISLQKYLENHNVVGIAEIDTRYLTHLLRTKGHLSACIVSDNFDPKKAQQLAAQFQGVRGTTFLNRVTIPTPYRWKNGSTSVGKLHIVVYDFGTKSNILRILEKL